MATRRAVALTPARKVAAKKQARAPKGTSKGGRFVSKGGTTYSPPKVLSKSEKAKLAYVPATASRQKAADRAEASLSKKLGVPRTGDNKPFDLQSRTVGIEVKTMFDSKNSKITMNKYARALKEEEASRKKLRTFTVVVDRRQSARQPIYYYARGFGSFRLSSMKMAPDVASLKRALRIRS